ncbi:hypothetical protein [Dysgonomonas mossii]|uniref:Uncharacterized protein n=1 Tax=Dysgonomonas mossii DSM 22836 TaxID=742767 RepID=F8X1C8_9BACT|nr:hypothetical protein [Dysgonomonas mossii]EGK03400.1 hypothetical protein HMPREF9456_02037 [Dysgonomonas mossii DSM 22836]
MELKEFVKETLIQITEGVMEAQEECFKSGGLINPMLAVKTSNEEVYKHHDSDYPATKITFKVGLTESDTKDNKKGIGVFLGKMSLGAESSKGSEIQSVTSIEFSVVAVLPYVDREGGHIPISALNIR